MTTLTGKLSPIGVLTGKLSYTSLEIAGGSGLTFINETAAEALVPPVPSELKMIEHAESEEI